MLRGHKNAVANDEISIPIVLYWSEDEICRMDIKFTDAMMTAIAAGLEQCTIGVRTAAGTKHPIINYRRPD
jgi:hypothetical protein